MDHKEAVIKRCQGVVDASGAVFEGMRLDGKGYKSFVPVSRILAVRAITGSNAGERHLRVEVFVSDTETVASEKKFPNGETTESVARALAELVGLR